METEPNTRAPLSAELLYLLHGDPAELSEACAGLRAADIAEPLRDLAPEVAAKVMAALPFDMAVEVFDDPELEHHRYWSIRRHEEPSRFYCAIPSPRSSRGGDSGRRQSARAEVDFDEDR